jgi:4-alpha-glucanotransferase
MWPLSDRDQLALELDEAPPKNAEELRARLQRDGLVDDAPAAEAVAAAYEQLGRAPSLLLSFALEDAVGEERRPNVPGTTPDARDNWRVPLPVPVDELADHPGPAALLRAAGIGR